MKHEFIDIHYHANPDLYERRHSALHAGHIYKQLNGAAILKSHIGSTHTMANEAQKEGLPIYASLVLNKVAGGIDYKKVLHVIKNYQPSEKIALLVHFPTITGRHHASKLKRTIVNTIAKDAAFSPETVSDENQKLKPSVIDVLKLSLDHPIVISSGHANKIEVELLAEACFKLGIKKLLLNQPASPLTGLTFEDLWQFSQYDFIWFEQTALTYLLGYQSHQDFLKVMTTLPRVIYSSDLGQTSQVDIKKWYQSYYKMLTDKLIKPLRWKQLIKTNPENLLTY